jgi:hypothetical protein
MTAGTSTQGAVRSTTTNGRPVGRAIVLFFAVGQLVSNLVFTLWSPTDLRSGTQFSPLIPPGAMFSIWAVIIAASVLWAILQVRPSVRQSPLRDRLVVPLSVVYAGFALWLAAASLGQDSPLTLVVFIGIVAAHFVAWRRISAARDEIARWKPLDRVVLYVSQGLYAGWTSMAFFVNIATVVQASGSPIEGTWGTTWQLLVVAAAAGTAVAFVLVSRGSVWYALASCYALVGAAISSSAGGFTALAVALGIGVVLVVASTIVVRVASARSDRRVAAARKEQSGLDMHRG